MEEPTAGGDAATGGRPDGSPVEPRPPMTDAGVIVPDPDAAVPVDEEPDAAPEEPPCTVTTVNLLANPTFDSGPGAGWQESSSLNYGIVLQQDDTPVPAAHSPSFLAWLGGDVNLTDSVTQTVTIPADASAMQVRGQRWIASAETVAGAFDVLRLDIATTGGTQLELVKEWSNLDSTSTWSAFNLPVTGNYQGQTVQLRFRGSTDSSENTNFFLDSLLFEVTTCQ